jgi:hypothetical protein
MSQQCIVSTTEVALRKYEAVISGTGAAICTAVLVARCNVDDSTLGVSVQDFTHLVERDDFLRSFYLKSCIWPDAISDS